MQGLSPAQLWYSTQMANGHHIRAVGRDGAQLTSEQGNAEAEHDSTDQAVHDPVLGSEGEIDLSDYEEIDGSMDVYDTSSNRFEWARAALAIATIVGWTAFYAWAMHPQFLAAPSLAPSEWVRWIIDWSVPVLLVGIVWLVAMRNSRTEAKRFAQTANLLSQESGLLENRLTVVNRELSLAREFLGTQSRELDSIGRVASERLSTHAQELQALIQSNGAQVDAIGSASEAALNNMIRLRDDLPVVANSARDVSNQVGNAGRTAHEQLEKLVGGFERLNQFGTASETQVQSFDKRIGSTLEGFKVQIEAIATTIATRLDKVEERTGAYRRQIDETEEKAITVLSERLGTLVNEAEALSTKLHEAEDNAIEQLYTNKQRFEEEVIKTVSALDELDQKALMAAQKRVQALHEEAQRFDDKLEVRDRKFVEDMAKRQEEFDTREAQASEVLAQRLADLDDALSERREAQTRETEKLVAHSESITKQLERLNALIGEIAIHGEATRDGLETGIDSLGEQLQTKRVELEETEARITHLTEAGIRLLEIIQSGAKHSREDLPKAIEVASQTLGSVEERTAALSTLMLGTSEQAQGLGDYLIEAQAKIETADSSIDALSSKLSDQSEDSLAKLQGLRSALQRLTEESEGFSGEAQDRLRQSLSELEVATQTVFTALEEGAQDKVDTLSDTISQRAVAELERSLRNHTAETVGKLEQAASHASGVGREATAQLRDQLAKVNDLTKNLEQRVSRARELAEEQVGNDFARRMALITDSLNSNAIDIASALSTEVADTSWDAYLKGDRGIFTRRSLRLIENGEARDIADLYQRDDTFRANVNRYIHDFEAMLRSMLSTRDGNALGVTILGSDMGKLYVVLAQAIERFRQ